MRGWTALQQGRQPWLPTGTASNLVELHFYDVPLAGMFDSHGVTHVFACLRGESGDTGLWVYGPLPSVEAAARLQAAEYDSAADVVEAITDALADSNFTLALSAKDEILVFVEYEAGKSLDAAVADFWGQLGRLVRNERERAESHRVRADYVSSHKEEIRELLIV
jgi:hypothetical protein